MELKVFAVKDRLVCNLEALMSKPSARRFVGMQWDASLGKAGGYVGKTEPELLKCNSVENFNEYIKAIRLGDLLPADEQTARLANVKFNKR